MAKQINNCHRLEVMEGADYKGAYGTFLGGGNVLSLDFIGGHVTACTCQNAANFIPRRMMAAPK